MKFNLAALSNLENKMVQEAQVEYSITFDNAHKLVALIWTFISNVDPVAWIFMSFVSQVQKTLSLALLSVIRNHSAQALMMLRQSLEAAVLACYALYKPVSNEFGKIGEEGTLKEDNKISDKANKWLGKNYTSYSEKIKSMKKDINKLFVHSNIVLAQSNFEFADSKMITQFFDREDKLITKQQLWWIANISFGLLDLFSKIIKDFPKVQLVSDFDLKMRELGVENDNIRRELKKETQFLR